MDTKLTEEQLAVQQAAREFAQIELLPGVIDRDEKEEFPAEQIKKMGEMGFLGMMVDPKYGGGGMDTVSYVLAMEEISKIDASCSVVMSVNNSLVCWGLEKFGTEEQKQKYLVPLATGQKLGAFCLSEPEAGSDATSQRTTAEDKGDFYLLNGTKNWITNGNSADVCIVIAQTDKAKKHHGINALIVEKGLDLAEALGHRWVVAELYRLNAVLLMLAPSNNQSEVETKLHLSLKLARKQQARSIQLRSATALGWLRLEQGEPADAMSLLMPLFQTFNEGFDTLDLKEARALLEKLS
jgi:alkylation response protein AidB-like acyl-CoA dehydrogenase